MGTRNPLSILFYDFLVIEIEALLKFQCQINQRPEWNMNARFRYKLLTGIFLIFGSMKQNKDKGL